MNILYICTHNRCRSILSEAITNHYASNDVRALSAGSSPVGEVHPLSLKYLTEHGVSIDGLSSQSWDAFEDADIDMVVTVCDHAANEPCPMWFGDAIQVHWGLPDPSKLKGSEEEIRAAFYDVIRTIETRVHALLSLELHTLSNDEQQAALETLA
ncbi:MAG: arsenate reductase ArsC [Pseudomonadota bacterium]